MDKHSITYCAYRSTVNDHDMFNQLILSNRELLKLKSLLQFVNVKAMFLGAALTHTEIFMITLPCI